MTGQELYDSHNGGDTPDVLIWGTDWDGVLWDGEPAMVLILPDCLKAYAMDGKTEQRTGYFHPAGVRVELADHNHLRRPMVPQQGLV